MRGPVLSLRRLRYTHADGRELALAVPLTAFPGQAVVITGPSGAGKSTLLRALADCPPEGGQVRWEADVLPTRSALALQDPEAQLLCSRVGEEVELGPRNQGLSGEPLRRRVEEALAALDIVALAPREVHALSMGQKQRVALAALLSMRPEVLLLDEPFSQLDAPGEARLRTLLADLKSQGCLVIVTAHAMDPADPLWDIRLDLPLHDCGRLDPCLPTVSSVAAEAPGDRDGPVLEARGLCLRRETGDAVFDRVDLVLQPGRTMQLSGGNATGKSTLLRCLAGILPLSAGEVRIDGLPLPRPGRLAGRLAYLPQNADMLLFEESVRREVEFTLRRVKSSATERASRADAALQACGLVGLASRAPLSLSHGERHMLALASVLAARPDILLLDEPLTGLDGRVARIVLALLEFFAREHGTAVLLASHGKLPLDWGDDRYVLEEGRLHAMV